MRLEPGRPITITVECGREHFAADFQAQLTARSVSELITPDIALPVNPSPQAPRPTTKPSPAPPRAAA